MEFSATRRGSAIVAGWAAAAGLILIWALLPAGRIFLALFWVLLCFGLLAPHLESCRVRVGGNHLTIRRGLIFFTTKRIPLRFITGCCIFRSPLCRACGTCVMLLFASGNFTVLPGVRLADAEHFAQRISHGGKLL